MKSARKKLMGLAILLLFLVPLGIAGRKIYWELRQPYLNASLITAVRKNDTAAVMALLQKGADPNAKDIPFDKRPMWLRLWDRLRGKPLHTGHGHTVLLVALEMHDVANWPPLFPEENVPLIKALVAAGSSVNVTAEDGTTPLMWAAMATKRETVRLLLDNGATINAKSDDGSTALHCAAPEGDPALVNLLLTRGARVNAKGISDTIPLHQAAFRGKTRIVRMLLDNGSDVNAREKNGDTPLFNAVMGDHTDCVKLLISRGAQVNTHDDDGDTPLTWARLNHNTQIVQMLKVAARQQAKGTK